MADITSICRSYYTCNGDYTYKTCPSGFLYSEQSQECAKMDTRECSGNLEPTDVRALLNNTWQQRQDVVASGDGSQYVGYYQSWSEDWTLNAESTQLANLPPYVTQVAVSFFKPDSTYSGGLTWEGTGLGFSMPPEVIKNSISILKTRNPGTKVLLSVGGATYDNWAQLNANAAVTFVDEFGLDGVDIDFEPRGADCQKNITTGKISCATDSLYIEAVTKFRAALGNRMLTAAVFSVGAYGEGIYSDAQPQGGYTGCSINMLNSVGYMLDSLNIMAYDAGLSFNPKEAYAAYTSYFSGPIQLGMQVAREAWGDHVISNREVVDLSTFVRDNGGSGMMLWSLQKKNEEGPSAQQISTTVCTIFGLPQCLDPLFPMAPSPPPLDPVFPPPPPGTPVLAPPPPFFKSPPPPSSPSPERCVYTSVVRIKTTGCKANKYLAYNKTNCKDSSVKLQSYKSLAKDWSQSYWSLKGISRSNMPIEATKRFKKCGFNSRYLAVASKNGQVLRLSSSSWVWRLVPVSDGNCNKVQIYSARNYRYLTTDSTCTSFSYTRGSGSVFELAPTIA
jgi:chitinase